MKKATPFAITISRQLGSGGAYVGKQLADKLDFFYADREIIRKAARQLSVFEKDLESRDEKLLSFWESIFQVSTFSPEAYSIPVLSPPTSRELFETESDVIEQIVKKRSSVIIGRCGFHILHEHPNHVSIFLHANMAFRNDRIKKLYNVTREDADKMITKCDKERALYCRTFTGKEWTDARNYDISIDTGKTGIDKTVELVLNYMKLFS